MSTPDPHFEVVDCGHRCYSAQLVHADPDSPLCIGDLYRTPEQAVAAIERICGAPVTTSPNAAPRVTPKRSR